MRHASREAKRRRWSALAAVVALTGLAVPFTAGRTAAAGACKGAQTSGAFTRIASPDGHPVTSYAVDPDRPARIFASTGQVIFATADGGCSWSTARPASGFTKAPDTEGLVATVDRVGPIVTTSASSVTGQAMVYAALSPCEAAKLVADVPGCAVLASADNGGHWAGGLTGLPVTMVSIDSLAVAPSAPRTVYAVVKLAGGVNTSVWALYRSTDAAGTWTQQSTQVQPPLAVDPLDRNELWARGTDGLVHSTDGGRTWTSVPGAGGVPTVVAVDHEPGSPAHVAVAPFGGGVTESSDGGRTWSPLVNSPADVNSIAFGSRPGDLVVTTDRSSSSAGAPFLYSPARGWSRIPGAFRETAAQANRRDAEAFYLADDNIPGILRYLAGGPTTGNTAPDDFQGAAGLGPTSGEPRTCHEGPGVEDSPDPIGPTRPAPRGEGPILVDNFDTGCVVAFDRFGHARILMQAPAYAEGVALTFDKQLIITTRFSRELTVTQLPHQIYSVLDANLANNEGPTFDRRGNLYVEDNLHNQVYVYPFPQYPGERRRLVHSFGPHQFLEDMRIAPPNSPFAGDLLVQYAADNNGGGNPDAIAVLRHTRAGWRRLPDFCHFPSAPVFISIGMAFMPDGSLLIPDFTGSGLILRYSPDGKNVSVFANIGTNQGQYSFAKIDVTARGYVYVSASIQVFAAGGGDLGDGDVGSGAAYYAGTRNAVVRFDPNGNRMLPDFTEDLSNPNGIAVPNVITGLTQLLPKLPVHPQLPAPHHVVPPRAVPPAAPPPPPPPPAQPAAQSPLTVPFAAPAPMAVPAAQGQAQANPVSQAHPVAQPIPQFGAVTQTEAKLQLATAQADRVEARPAEDHPMVARRTPFWRTDAAVETSLLGGALVTLLCATRLAGSRRPAPASARAPSPVAGRRRRVRCR